MAPPAFPSALDRHGDLAVAASRVEKTVSLSRLPIDWGACGGRVAQMVARRLGATRRLVTLLLGAQAVISRPEPKVVDVGQGLQIQEPGMGGLGAMGGKKGAVASENGICSQIGIDLLRRGGNAADALVGTTFCVGVIGMYHSGIGGGGFMVVRSSDGEYEHIDFRESAPAAAYEDMYKHNINGSILGGLASGVPGEVRGLDYVHRKYGKLPWREVVLPAVRIARFGFPVSMDLVRFMDIEKTVDGGCGFLCEDPNWAIDFAPNGRRLEFNDTITRKRYADALEVIAESGPDAFYTGPIAQTMVRAMEKENGTMTMQDLADYKVEIRPTYNITYRGYRLTSGGAPSGGTVALSALKILEGYHDAGDVEALNISTHRLTEAMRFAYAERTKMGDPSFVEDMDDYDLDMLREETAEALRLKISDSRTFNVSYYNPDGIESLNDHGTSHVVTADNTGLAISLTTTVNLIFGSKVLVPETGIIMNNEMNDFSIPHVQNEFGYAPSPSNYVRPRKRPLSSISPVIVDHLSNNSLALVIGAAGGSRIITATMQGLWHVLDHGWDLYESLKAPRVHDQLIPNTLWMEDGYDAGTVEFMKGRGHNITFVPLGYSSMQALRVRGRDGVFEAQGEPRQKASRGYVI